MEKKRAPKNPDVTRIVEQTVREFGGHPYHLAHGNCAYFRDSLSFNLDAAGIAHEIWWDDHLMPDEQTKELGVGVPGHTFVQVGALFYDAEEPIGVRHWLMLPTFARQIAEYRLFPDREVRDPVWLDE